MGRSMERTVKLFLSKFHTTPNSLRQSPAIDKPTEKLPVNLTDLYFHYYRDMHGRSPPNPDPSLFEHLQYLTPTREFRLLRDGFGVSTSSRRILSTEMGCAFCRCFLHDHLNILYFAHIDRVLDRAMKAGFGDMFIMQTQAGDLPDYFCAEAVNKVYLAEAKGRHSAISFTNKEFQSWRNQFDRLEVQRPKGVPLSVKGYIVATRFATESKPYTESAVYVEDPRTPGEGLLSEEQGVPLGSAVLALHYADMAHKLNQPVLAEALDIGFTLPDEIIVPTVVWELRAGPLAGKRFVGGYYPSSEGGPSQLRIQDGSIVRVEHDPFRLDIRHATFIGLEERIFSEVVEFARGIRTAGEISRLDGIQFFYSAISILRDGSVIGPLDFFSPVANRNF